MPDSHIGINTRYRFNEIGIAALSTIFMQSPSMLKRSRAVSATRSFSNRMQLTRAVCEEFGIYDFRGQEQSVQIMLPVSIRLVRKDQAGCLSKAVALPEDIE